MNSRERRLVWVLALLAVGGLAVGAYALVVTPIQDSWAEAAKLNEEIGEKSDKLVKMKKDMPRMEAAKKRSLPADPDTARTEYAAMLRRLLIKAGTPAGFTIVPKDGIDNRSVPQLDTKPKKPAYTRVGFEIQMQKVDVGTLVKFLEAYYRLNLLQQISRIDIARKDDSGSKAGKGVDRNDLTVTLLTEAIILDGAENRQTLLSVPLAAALVGGNGGYFALLNSKEAGREITPQQFAPVLASAGMPREYAMVTAKNFIHGSLPPPPKPVVKPIEIVEPPPPVILEDISPHIKLTGIVRNPSGGAEAGIWDKANNHSYTVTLIPKGEKFETKMRKTYVLGGKDKLLDSSADLIIEEAGTSTNRHFKVVGWSGEDLILTETMTPANAGEKKPPSGRDKKPALPAPPPAAAVFGGSFLATAPVGERVFAWRVGQTLKSLVELNPSEARDAIQRAYPRPLAGAAVPVSTVNN